MIFFIAQQVSRLQKIKLYFAYRIHDEIHKHTHTHIHVKIQFSNDVVCYNLKRLAKVFTKHHLVEWSFQRL